MGKGKSPLSRTMEVLRKEGADCWQVERWISFGEGRKFGEGNSFVKGIRIDLFNFLDIIVLTDQGIVGIQCCGADFAAHDRKIMENEYAPKWIKFAQIELHGWRKVKLARGMKAMRWKPRIKIYSKEDFDGNI